MIKNFTKKSTQNHPYVFQELGWEEKREVVQVLIDKIYLTEDINTYEIVWNF